LQQYEQMNIMIGVHLSKLSP